MIFSHISDMHLGFIQYYSEERENDVYQAFNEAIDISIKDHVDFVILAGDIFHMPNPSGKAILVLANTLKKLKQNNIETFFVLGEHDISRIRATPVPFVYHNLEYSKYIGNGKPFQFKDVLILGYDKRRKNEISRFESDFATADSVAKNHKGHKILVLHQGIGEINKFAAELNSTDLPRNFTYYAMGHLHEKELKNFSHLGGPLAYPGSIELTSSEGIKETQKGFYQVDISTSEAKPNWLKLDTRPQFSIRTRYDDLAQEVEALATKFQSVPRKPVVEIKIHGKKIETNIIQGQVAKLFPITLRCFWKVIHQAENWDATFVDKPAKIDDEMMKLARSILNSDHLADFAIKELLPLLSSNHLDEATHLVIENFNRFKKEKKIAD